MNRRIPDEVIEAVLKAHDIVDVVGRYVHLTKQGHYMKGLCPFHSEKTPSFTVTPEKQIYYCYGCHAGGNAIHFLMEIEGYTFGEAVRQMAEDASIPIGWEPEAEEPTGRQLEMRTLYEAYEFSAKTYHYILRNTEQGKPALDYLRKRGIHDKIIDAFLIGYAPSMYDKLAQFLDKRGYDLPLMERGGLLTKRSDGNGYIDKFRDRVMFPICDHKGRPIAFGGRAMGDVQPKYMNSPETMLFNKSRSLYNFHQARAAVRKSQSVVLLEGYVDVIKAWEAGVANGVASMGTALTQEHAALLRRNAEEAVLCYDGDQAGQAAAYKSIALLEKEGFRVKVCPIPNGMDPDEYITEYGAERFRREIVESALTSMKFKLLYIRKNFNLQDVDGRLRYIETALRMIAELPLPVEREHYLKELSAEFPYSAENMKQQMFEYRQEFLKKHPSGDNPDQSWNNVINNGRSRGKPAERKPAQHRFEVKLLAAMLHDRNAAEYVQDKLGDRFSYELHGVLAAYLYRFYAQGFEPDVSRFVATLNDDKLESLATSISMEDYKHALSLLDDYILAVQIIPQLASLRKQEEEALNIPDKVQAAKVLIELKNEIQALEKQLKSL